MLLHARGADAGAPARCLLDDEEPLRVGFSGIRSGNLDRLSPSRFSEALTTLQDHLLLWFCPQRSDSFVVYPPPSSGLAALLSRDSLRAGFPSQRKTQRLSAVQLQWERHLHHAVASLGGPGLFLFLLARVVECTSEAGPQSLALELVLGLLRRPGATWGTPRPLLGQQEALHLLGQLVAHPRWAADSPRCLQVAVNACGSRDLVQGDGEGSLRPVSFPVGQDPLLVWPELLCILVEHWRTGTGWKNLLALTWGLFRERHPYRDLNLARGKSLLHHLLARLKVVPLDALQSGLSHAPIAV